MRTLGIDPGFGKCGWAVLAKGEQFQISNFKFQNKESNLKSEVGSLQLNKSAICNLQSEITLVDCDCIETDNKKDLPSRLKEIYDGIQYVIKKYKPQELAIEELFWFKNQKTALDVAQARGVIITAARNLDLEIYEYTPLQVKQAVVGYGRADKNQIQKMIKIHLGGQMTPKQDDTADAIAVGLTHLQTSDLAKAHESNSNYTRKSQSDLAKAHESNSNYMRKKNPEIIYPELSYQIIGALYDTWKELGGGFNERYYYPKIGANLNKKQILFKTQVPYKLNNTTGRCFIDFIIEDKIVLEIKIGTRFYKRDIDQTMAYLRMSDMKLAILARFSKSGVTYQRLLKRNNF